MKLKDMHESLDHDLQDPEYAAFYLNDALHEGSADEFLLALRNIIRVTQEMNQITTQTELEKDNLDKKLAESGNLQFSTVYEIISALGLQISIKFGRKPCAPTDV
jgi:probable addiction module antidote protein